MKPRSGSLELVFVFVRVHVGPLVDVLVVGSRVPELTLQRGEVHVGTVRLEFAGDLGVLRLLTATANARDPLLRVQQRACAGPDDIHGTGLRPVRVAFRIARTPEHPAVLRPLRRIPNLFLYIALDRQRANLAMARLKAGTIEQELKV